MGDALHIIGGVLAIIALFAVLMVIIVAVIRVGERVVLPFLMSPFLFLFVKHLTKNGKRVEQLAEQNKDKAILHIFGKKCLIDGIPLAAYNPLKGEGLEPVVAVAPGMHVFEGRFYNTDQNLNFKSDMRFELALAAGHRYTLALYLSSPEEREADNKGSAGRVVLSLPVYVGLIKKRWLAYIICYQDEVVLAQKW